MKKGLNKLFEKLGEHLLNVSVAIIVFSIIQPLVNGRFDKNLALYFTFAYFLLLILSSALIILGGSEDDE